MDPGLWELLEEEGRAEVEALVRLVAGAPSPPGLEIIARFGEIASCRLARSNIHAIWSDDAIASLKSPRRVAPEPRARASDSARRSIGPRADTQETGRGTVIGVIDWGVDFAHPNFLDANGRTRLLAIWDQRPPHKKNRYRRGRILGREAIDRALESSDPYSALHYFPMDADAGDGTHGTHTLDICAGNGAVGWPGVAPESDLVFVHLSAEGVDGRRTLGDSVAILEAVDFIFRVAGDRPCAINISVGTHGGPHDGTTLLEQAFDAALLARPGRAILNSAGNYYDRRTHAGGRLVAGDSRRLRVLISDRDPTENEVEVWYSGRDRFAVEILLPNGRPAGRAALGERTKLTVEGREVGRLYHRANDPNNGDHQIDLFLDPLAPGGVWQVKLDALEASDGRFHAWIERDEGGGTQSIFAAPDAEPSCTTGTICNARNTIAVGAYDPRDRDRAVARFSSAGPTRDGRAKPEILAPGVGIVAAKSSQELSSEVPSVIAKSGTSMAAPHVTGCVALMFEAASRPLSIEETRQILFSTASPVGPNIAPGRGGNGYLQIEAAVEAAARIGRRRQSGAAAVEAVLRRHLGSRSFAVIAAPRARIFSAPSPGDLILRWGLGEGSIHVSRIAAEVLWRLGDAAPSGLKIERGGPGWYATVIDLTGPYSAGERLGRRLADAAGRLPIDQILVRPTGSTGAAPLDIDRSG